MTRVFHVFVWDSGQFGKKRGPTKSIGCIQAGVLNENFNTRRQRF
jgi:hypothetical protein